MTTPLLLSPPQADRSSEHIVEHEFSLAEQPRRPATAATNRAAPCALLLGCENVLYDATVWDRWLVRLLRHVGVMIDQNSFGQEWGRIYAGDIHRGRRDFDEAFRSFLKQLGLSRGLADEVAAASQGRRQQFLKETRPLPHIRQTIAAIARLEVPLGLLADSELTAAELERHLRRLGFGGRFQFVLSSVELGATKAEEDGYRAAADRFGRSLARIAFVGSLDEHLSIAAQLDMPTIAFNYEEQALADIYIRQFDDLIGLVKRWGLSDWTTASAGRL